MMWSLKSMMTYGLAKWYKLMPLKREAALYQLWFTLTKPANHPVRYVGINIFLNDIS